MNMREAQCRTGLSSKARYIVKGIKCESGEDEEVFVTAYQLNKPRMLPQKLSYDNNHILSNL